jgi:hypothetical protein
MVDAIIYPKIIWAVRIPSLEIEGVFMANILGVVLVLVSVYFLGDQIWFSSYVYSNWWQQTSATASVVAMIVGVGSLTFWRQTMGNFGWAFIAISIILVFLSGGVILRPTSLWHFLVSMLAFASGYQLLTRGRIKF